MNKKTQIVLGLGVITAIGTLLYWKSKQPKSNFLGITNKKAKKTKATLKRNVSADGKKTCPKGYTEKSGYCLPRDITKIVIPASLSKSSDSIFVKDGLMPTFGVPVDLK